jgi:hypothetical protein
MKDMDLPEERIGGKNTRSSSWLVCSYERCSRTDGTYGRLVQSRAPYRMKTPLASSTIAVEIISVALFNRTAL